MRVAYICVAIMLLRSIAAMLWYAWTLAGSDSSVFWQNVLDPLPAVAIQAFILVLLFYSKIAALSVLALLAFTFAIDTLRYGLEPFPWRFDSVAFVGILSAIAAGAIAWSLLRNRKKHELTEDT